MRDDRKHRKTGKRKRDRNPGSKPLDDGTADQVKGGGKNESGSQHKPVEPGPSRFTFGSGSHGIMDPGL